MSNLMIAGCFGHFAAVEFEFRGPAEEAIAILGDHDRYLDIDWDYCSDPAGMTMISEFADKHLGNRAGVWALAPEMFVEIRQEFRAFNREVPWALCQEQLVRSLLWVGKHSGVPMELPETAQLGMSRNIAVHRAIQQVMLAQAAFWSLTNRPGVGKKD